MTKTSILVTGSHRSGTTWVGKMIASSSDVFYLHEPFNINQKKEGIYHKSFKNWFTYINHENEKQYYKPLLKTISLHYDLFSLLKSEGISKENFRIAVSKWLYYRNLRKHDKRILIKDPIAIFSSEWLAERFDSQVIVLIRHPAAFAGSLKQKKWNHPFKHFLNQPNLMAEHLSIFKGEIEEFAKNPHDIIDQACLLWRIIYFMVYKFQIRHNNWLFLRHEDISRNPIKHYQEIYNYLNLDFTSEVCNIIKSYSQAPNFSKNEIKRNSLLTIYSWKKRLSEGEIFYIKEKVKDISTIYYSDNDW